VASPSMNLFLNTSRIATVNRTRENMSDVMRKSQNREQSFTGKLYKKNVRNHFVIQNESWISCSSKCSMSLGYLSASTFLVKYSKNPSRGSCVSYNPMIIKSGCSARTLNIQKASGSFAPFIRRINPKMKFMP